jgi:hypothetical protein
MARALGITRQEHTSEELRRLSGRCADGSQVRRLSGLGSAARFDLKRNVTPRE